jgi:hypothetical protein
VRERAQTAITATVITVSARTRTPHLPERTLTAITRRPHVNLMQHRPADRPGFRRAGDRAAAGADRPRLDRAGPAALIIGRSRYCGETSATRDGIISVGAAATWGHQ